MACVLKISHCDGEELPKSKWQTWCGKVISGWYFLDAQHAAMAREQNCLEHTCGDCKEAIINALNTDLDLKWRFKND